MKKDPGPGVDLGISLSALQLPRARAYNIAPSEARQDFCPWAAKCELPEVQWSLIVGIKYVSCVVLFGL